jgi:hypothetical protein
VLRVKVFVRLVQLDPSALNNHLTQRHVLGELTVELALEVVQHVQLDHIAQQMYQRQPFVQPEATAEPDKKLATPVQQDISA